VAVPGGSRHYYFPVLNEEVDKIAALIAAGHPLELRVDEGRYGYTPLNLAAAEQKLRSVEALVEGGADVNGVGAAGFTPLQLGIKGSTPRDRELAAEIVRYLVEHGARPTAKDVELVEGLMGQRMIPIFPDDLKLLVRAAFEGQQ